ncbi:YggS family pyridoxal phosphate-dependent enzyme [Spirulina subsalsa]|uniref:YggS family pyridoxal phosphate-dependent enzyme n=1 Tax=Spirulina subsalsa TaxID=54311 RepID=UPI0002E4C8E3|nr:YggS family pyridoxal phosphate-dependent enzyme [Spirulina subsalsa]
MSSAIAQNLARLHQTVPPSVRLIAVSKTFPPAAIREAYATGIRDFGESRIQEAIPKQEALQDLTDIQWHFIGHLQTNKARKALQHFHWIHTCDSLKLAQRLNQIAPELPQSPQILLQVKIRPDPDKYGWTPAQLQTDLEALDHLNALKIQGLMTILPLGLTEAETLKAFEDLQDLRENIGQQTWVNLKMEELSMGMSGDYPLAIQGGATMIRLGRIIFGTREASQTENRLSSTH